MMKMRELTALGLVVAGTVGFVIFHRAEEQRAIRELERRQEVELLRRELSEVQADAASQANTLARWPLRRGAETERVAPMAANAEAEAEDTSGSDAATQKTAPEHGRVLDDGEMEAMVLASVDSTFAAEPNDAAWSPGAHQQLSRAMVTGLPEGSSLEKVECRSSLCKVDTRHRSVAEFRSFVEGALLERGRQAWNAGFYAAVVDQSDQGIAAVAYVAREGQSVPLPEVGN